MITNKIFIKKLLSFFPFLNKFIRKIYYNIYYGTFFIPLDLRSLNHLALNKNIYRLNYKNFTKFEKEFSYFLIFNRKSILNYSKQKLDKLIGLIKSKKFDVVYDGDDPNGTEIISSNVLSFYLKKYPIENYPHRFFYIKKNFKISNIGTDHRSYNFNGSFLLPSGGMTIGDSGPIDNRLNYIPELNGKSFLDIGSEEGYAVFQAINKGASLATGFNIKEDIEYDFFPEFSRPSNITTRSRDEIEKTQRFLLKQYNFENHSGIKFEYKNIYNLTDEKFDFVFCFGVLYHLKNPYLALENLFKVTKETLIIETQGIKNDRYLNACISTKDGFIRHSSNALSFLLKRTGFKKVTILFESYDKSMKLQNIVLKAEKE
tara:strand:+ start:446 stop:1564 length:1119 start_codon:yes stop_codon:yes gene_type:complete